MKKREYISGKTGSLCTRFLFLWQAMMRKG